MDGRHSRKIIGRQMYKTIEVSEPQVDLSILVLEQGMDLVIQGQHKNLKLYKREQVFNLKCVKGLNTFKNEKLFNFQFLFCPWACSSSQMIVTGSQIPCHVSYIPIRIFQILDPKLYMLNSRSQVVYPKFKIPSRLSQIPKIPDPRYQILDTRSMMLGPRYCILDTRSQLLDTRSQILDPRYCILDTRSQILNTRYQILNTRYQILDPRYQILEILDPRSQILDTRYQILDPRFYILDPRYQI